MAEGIGNNGPNSEPSHNEPTLSKDRENIVDAAVRFLQNPLVQRTSAANQKAFLRNKGLSDDEIKFALHRAAVAENKRLSPILQSNVLQSPPPVPARTYNFGSPSSTGTNFRNFLNSVLLICGFSYGIYQFYKQYLHHVLFGDDGGGKRESLEETYFNTIEELRSSVRAINDTLRTLQEQQQQKQATETYATAKQIDDLKAELASVKSLLLGRNQFASPVLQTLLAPPSIPSWQLMTDTDDMKGSEEGTTHDCKDDAELETRTSGSGSSENDMVTTNGSDSSLEMISKNAY